MGLRSLAHLAHGAGILAATLGPAHAGRPGDLAPVFERNFLFYCDDLAAIGRDHAAFFGPFRQLSAECADGNKKPIRVDAAQVRQADDDLVSALRPPGTARNSYELHDWDGRFNAFRQAVSRASSSNRERLARANTERDIPSLSGLRSIEPIERRIEMLYQVLSYVLERPSGAEQHARRIVESDYRKREIEVDLRTHVVLTCLDIPVLLDRRPLTFAPVIEPLVERCYEAPNEPLVLDVADVNQRLAAVAGSAPRMDPFGPGPLRAEHVLKRGEAHWSLLTSLYAQAANARAAARRAEGERRAQAYQAEQRAAADERHRREEAEQRAQEERERQAEARRWAALTPAQRAAENAAAEQRQREQRGRQCSIYQMALENLVLQDKIHHALILRRQMNHYGCS